MQSFKNFLIEGIKKAKRKGTIQALTKESMRQAVRQARHQVDREERQEEEKLNSDDYLDIVKFSPVRDDPEETRHRFNISELINPSSANRAFWKFVKGEEKTEENYERLGKEFEREMQKAKAKAQAAEYRAYAAALADKIIDRQPIITNKKLQDSARQYEIETKTEKKIPLFGGAHKKYIYKHG